MAQDCFTDVPGLKVGHAHDTAARTGVTVILPDAPVTMAADVRGGGPGTRETDALAPHTLVERFHGLVLSGGSAFGLGAADAVTAWLSERGVGLPVGARPVPVVPAAILFDLANGGDKNWGMNPPYRRLALQACEAATTACPHGPVGAGFGAKAGSRPGGIGSASIRCERTGWTVSALIAVNSFGEVYPGEPPVNAPVALPKAPIAGTNTTIGAVATNAPLTKAQAQKLAQMAQDGLARAIRPIHTPFDGDTLFALATGDAGQARETGQAREIGQAGIPPLDLAVLGTLAADCTARAIRRAVGL